MTNDDNNIHWEWIAMEQRSMDKAFGDFLWRFSVCISIVLHASILWAAGVL